MSKPTPNNQQIKIKEFEWFEVETKVRELMGQILQPFNKKQTEETLKMNQIKRNINVIFKKLEDHDFLLGREDAQKPAYLQLQDEKIQEIANHQTKHRNETEGTIAKLETVINVYQNRIKQVNSLEQRLDTEIQERIDEFKKYKLSLDEQVGIMLKKQDTHQDQINSLRATLRTSTSKIDMKVISLDNRIKEQEDDLKRKSKELARLLDDSLIHAQKIAKVELQVVDVQARIADRDKDSKLSEKFFTKVKEVQNELDFLTRYLQSYQPLYIQMQISDTLDTFLKGIERRKVCIYEEKKFAELHQNLLSSQSFTLDRLMSSASNNIKKIINRNRKYIIDLQVQESIKYGTNIYEFRLDNFDHYQQEQQESSKPQPMIVPHQQISQAIEHKWAALKQSILTKFQEHSDATNKWVQQLQDQSMMRVVDEDRKINALKNEMKNSQMGLELQEKRIDSSFNQYELKIEELTQQEEVFKDFMREMVNFNSVINHIVIQDEIDRQGTALYALKANSRNNPAETRIQPAIQLDPNCVNCEGKTAGLIVQAFKMACLAYNPSEIRIDEQLFSRQEIFQVSTNILDRLKKRIEAPVSKLILRPLERLTGDKFLSGKKQSLNQTKVSTPAKQQKQGSKMNSTQYFQAMLPTLSASSKKRKFESRERRTHNSIFY